VTQIASVAQSVDGATRKVREASRAIA
jgi:hypothetical protein